MVAREGFAPHRVVVASDRIESYYQHAEMMLDREFGYVCQCSAEEFREHRWDGKLSVSRKYDYKNNSFVAKKCSMEHLIQATL